MKLYPFQEQAIANLKGNRHICIASVGCLAKGTPIKMADGTTKPVENVVSGDKVLSANSDGEIISNTVSFMIRTSHKHKPMIELEYDGEKITTTYDHYFDAGGDKYYPLYQLVWGALEESQRTQLKLLCKQYGTTIDYKIPRFKTSSSNEASVGRLRLLQNSNEWKDGESPQNCSKELARQPAQFTSSKPYKWGQVRQQSRKFRVGNGEIQCVVWGSSRQHYDAKEPTQYCGWGNETRNKKQTTRDKNRVIGEAEKQKEIKVKERISKNIIGRVSYNKTSGNKTIDRQINVRIKIKPAEEYYSIGMEKAPYTYCIGQEHCFITHNSGKGSIALHWAKNTGKKHILIVSTASKRDVKDEEGRNDFEAEADAWFGKEWRTSLSSFSVISWQGLAKWCDTVGFKLRNVDENGKKTYYEYGEICKKYAFIFDEVALAKAGVSSQRGKAFLRIAKTTNCWTGYTATPGDRWIDFYAYFTACGKVKNKTQFQRDFCNIQTFRGFPEIVGYKFENTLKEWWSEISDTVDTTEMFKQLPRETHQVIRLKKPTGYDKFMKTRLDPDTGDFVDTCLPADTLVKTNKGLKELDSIKIGDKVWSYNHTAKTMELKKVTNTYKFSNVDDVIKVHLSNGCDIISTRDHRHFVNNEYTRADKIKKGDYLYVEDKMLHMRKRYGDTNQIIQQNSKVQKEWQEEGRQIKGIRVESVEVLKLRDIKRRRLYRDPDYVYCIDVEGNHNFFANEVLTHNCMGVCHTARQLCWSKGKEQWVRDFMESLDTRAMFLYNYINEGDKLEEIISKTIKKGGKIWRIDGKHHDVPTADNIGERDVVLVQWTSGSMGLNLQFINYWVSVSPNYSYSTSEQGRGRIKRIGQNRPMYFYYLQCMDTIEEDIYKCLKNKSDFAEDIWGIEKGIKEGEE